ncbi:GSCFA domain-containing protein [Hymenobacter sublimis]|uniref:GSCFA domain-containing protein n=1 Tax=Hymenobacter sublimis TaxID=2933777 RepID=A0ABY4J842_9BACT|nr:GSCFA domain-containing protein [Hymenobacter sublimis]UPL48102.1 GSCFA domain-containing protein [Hymenobacter sublimis]
MFRTELPLTPHSQQLPLSARVLTIGSCFSDSIGSRLVDFKVATMVNPFGTVFNPLSACKLLRAAAGEDIDWQQHVVEARGRWQSYDLHAEVGADNPVALLQHIQTLTREAGVFLATADAVVLTLGTAYAYRLRETDEIISNCHKVPAEKFEREMLTADDIIAAVAETHAYLRRINPKLRFILTVSPVRHLKETLVLNSASKSMLRVACHYLSELLPDVSYFPAYELLLDDLRDYRFYASDMLHPSEVAENYIWERFTRTYFDTAFGRFKKEWEGIRQALGHRPLHAAAPEHRQFLEATLERLRKISSQADVRMEMLHVERELAALPIPAPEPEEPEVDEYDDDEERIDIGSVAPDEEAEGKESAASLVRPGAGLLVEPEEVDEEAEDEANITPESAYEHAYTLAQAEDQDDETEESADTDSVESSDEPVRKKKRRSRGGAKRTKRKHARLAAENTAGAATSSVSAEEATEPTPPAALAEVQEVSVTEPDSEVVYITEEELRRGNRPTPTPEPEPEVSQPAPEVIEQHDTANSTESASEHTMEVRPRRSRNKRREPRPEQADRPAGRTSRRPLYAAPDEVEANSSVPDEANVTSQPAAPESAVVPVAETPATPAPIVSSSDADSSAAPSVSPEPVAAQAEPTVAAKPTGRNRNSTAPATPNRPARSKKPQAATVTEDAPVESAAPIPPTPTDTTPLVVAPPAAPAAPKARSRKRPAAQEASVPPAEAPAAPVSVEASPVTPKKRAPRRPAPAAEASASSAPTLEAAPEAAPEPPKRRARPPRRKPDADPQAPENT